MKKINKTQAKNMVANNKEVYILPCKMRYDNMWVKPTAIIANMLSSHGETFDTFVNAYEYYNCNNETGKYAAFYVAE